jgi:phenylacetate-CoA ligase
LPASGNVDPEQWAVWWRYRGWHGIHRPTQMALFASAPVARPNETRRFWRHNYSQRETRYSIYHISRDTVHAYVAQLDAEETAWIHGNPSAISLLAHYMNLEGLRLRRPLRWLTVGSENLTSGYSATMQRAFNVKPIQHYGLAEANANFSECTEGSLHIDEDFAFVEFLTPDTQPSHQRIIGTSFANARTALLRYDTGDLATLSGIECRCGHWGRVVDSLDGRQGDYITLPSGARVASLASPFHSTTWLVEGQLFQDRKGDLEVRYVPNRPVSQEMLREFESRLRQRVGADVRVTFGEYTALPRTARGKVRLVVSDYEAPLEA